MTNELTGGSDDLSPTPLVQQFLDNRVTLSKNTDWQTQCTPLVQVSKQ